MHDDRAARAGRYRDDRELRVPVGAAQAPRRQAPVLNAKFHEQEAHIVAEAGRKDAVTIATNMAGRGTDIILGGTPEIRDKDEWQQEHEEVVAAGGLHIIGTERHESRRIDNQLRGRAGRQGDPGSSRFFVSFERRPHAPVRAGMAAGHARTPGHGREHADRVGLGLARRSRTRRPRSRATTSTSASTSSSTTT